VTLSIVILSYNRCAALRRTLSELRTQGLLDSAQVIVVDNGSRDSTGPMVQSDFPAAQLIQLNDNRGVSAFNLGADKATGDLLLLLDDDAWPAPNALAAATSLLDHRPSVAAVALLPKHPATNAEEWKHSGRAQPGWTMMGCGNLIRMDAWRRVEGYESSFFLYRNDTDLALKLLSAGYAETNGGGANRLEVFQSDFVLLYCFKVAAIYIQRLGVRLPVVDH